MLEATCHRTFLVEAAVETVEADDDALDNDGATGLLEFRWDSCCCNRPNSFFLY